MNTDDINYDKLVKIISHKFTFLKTKVLKGGITAKINLVEYSTGVNDQNKIVVRQFEQENSNKYIKKMSKAYKVLSILDNLKIPVPIPLFFDVNKNLFDNPTLIIKYIEGITEFEPRDRNEFIRKMVNELIKIHKIDINKFNFLFLVKFNNLETEKSFNKKNFEKNKNKDTLLHGDY